MRPEAAKTYPLDVLVRDVAVGFNLFFLCIAVPVAIGVVGADLPPDKAEFTWKSCVHTCVTFELSKTTGSTLLSQVPWACLEELHRGDPGVRLGGIDQADMERRVPVTE